MKLRYPEAFYSVQGEGRYVGVQCVLRTFGCNLYEFWFRKTSRQSRKTKARYQVQSQK